MELSDKETPMENLPNEVSADTNMYCFLCPDSNTKYPPAEREAHARRHAEAVAAAQGTSIWIPSFFEMFSKVWIYCFPLDVMRCARRRTVLPVDASVACGSALSPLPAAESNAASSSAVAPSSCVATCGGSNNEAQNFLSKGAAVIFRMFGLASDCTAAEIVEFFKAGGGNAVDVLDGEGGILFVKNPDGSPRGDAFVLISSEGDAIKAASKHKQSIGSRYVEVLRSSAAGVKRATSPLVYSTLPVTASADKTCPPADKAQQAAAPKPATAQKRTRPAESSDSSDGSSAEDNEQIRPPVAKKSAVACAQASSPTKQVAIQKTKKDSSSDDSNSSDDEADPAPPQKRLKAPVAMTTKPPAASAPVNKLQPNSVVGRKAESSSSDDSSDDEAAVKPAAQKPATVQVKKSVGSAPTAKATSVVASKKYAARDDSSSDSDDSSEDGGETAKPTNAFKSVKPAATAVKGSGGAASKSTVAAASKKAETSSSDSDSSDSGNKGGKTPRSVLAVAGLAAKTANTLAKAAVTSKKPALKKASSSDDSSSSSDDEQQMAAVKQLSGRYVCYVCSIRVDDSGSYNEHLSSGDHITAVKQSGVITDKPIPQAPPKTAAYYANKARKQQRNRANRYAKKAAARALL